MPAISSLGAGSGLDLSGILDKIMQAEAAPLAQLTEKEKEETTKITELSKLKSLLANLADSADTFGDATKFDLITVNSDDPESVSVTVSPEARNQDLDMTVSQLARAAKLRAKGYEKKTSPVGEGTITISIGRYDTDKKEFQYDPDIPPTSITIDQNNNSVEGIRDAINKAGAHVHASIIYDGSEQGAHLVITADDSGEKHNIKIQVTPPSGQTKTDLSALAYDPADPEHTGMTRSQAPQDAIVTVDGLTIHSDSNTLDKQIPGLTLHLKKITEKDKSVHIHAETDNKKSRSVLDKFIASYNKLMKALNAAQKKDSILNSNMGVSNLSRSLSDILNTFIETGQANIQYLSSLGVHSDENGMLSIDDDAFNKAMTTKDFDVSKFFMGKTDSSSKNVIIEKTNNKNKTINKDDDKNDQTIDVRNIHMNVTQPAKDASVLGDRVPSNITIDDNNATLTINNNGNITQIEIPKGQYTPEQLVAVINAKLHADSHTTQATMSIQKDAQGQAHYEMHNHQYGKNSNLHLSGQSANDIFGHMTDEKGQDVQVNIDGSIQTGTGQDLYYGGLSLKILSETPEENITITQSPGLNTIAGRILRRENGKDGPLTGSINSLNSEINNIEKQKTRLTDQLEALKERYQKQFSDLDSYLTKMNQTSNFLKSALR